MKIEFIIIIAFLTNVVSLLHNYWFIRTGHKPGGIYENIPLKFSDVTLVIVPGFNTLAMCMFIIAYGSIPKKYKNNKIADNFFKIND